MASSLSADAQARAARIKLMIFDVDGVLTDGRLYVGGDGEQLKAFSTLDGHGIKLLATAGIPSAIITGRTSRIVAARARELGIDEVFQGARDKRAAFAELCAAHGLEAAECGYMGDDWPDLPVLLACGFAAAPANAHPEVLARVHWIAAASGGQGAVRQLTDLLLRAQGRYDGLLAHACEG
jgi:3-deoxy-D-manno-octulosonate 8-phosphate phosphatase (KDO 8-P phosphatase)